jgi:hypothetical protein
MRAFENGRKGSGPAAWRAASLLARWSANSFPSTPLCPLTQWRRTEDPCVTRAFKAFTVRSTVREVINGFAVAIMAAWLSLRIVTGEGACCMVNSHTILIA